MKLFTYKKGIPAIVTVCILIGGVFLYHSTTNETRLIETESRGVPEDSIAIIKDQFQIDDKHYGLLSEEQRTSYSFPDTIAKKDIGEKIATITTTVDTDYLGKEVYEYFPAAGKAIVVVKKDNEYKLFKFFQFESYINNSDEDVSTYFALYGINSAEDIRKIQFIQHSEAAKIEGREDIVSEITDLEKIKHFYQFYSVIKESSIEYFEKLFNYKPSPEPQNVEPDGPITMPIEPDNSGRLPMKEEQTITEPDRPSDLLKENASSQKIMTDQAGDSIGTQSNGKDSPVIHTPPSVSYDRGNIDNSSSGSTPGFEGTAGNALANSVTIRIYNQYGVYFDTVYYPNMGFISRHKVNEEFGIFLDEYL